MVIFKQIPMIGLFFHVSCQEKNFYSENLVEKSNRQKELLTKSSRLSKFVSKNGEIGQEDPLSALGTAIPGVPGEDYPIYSQPPETSFFCSSRVNGGYYADPEAQCQTFHICAGEEAFELTKFSFLCPNGTLFQQQYFVCDWWFNVDCSKTEDFYILNDRLQAAREAASLAAALRESGDLASWKKVTDGNSRRHNNQERKPAANFQQVSRGSGLRKGSSSSSSSKDNSLPGSSANVILQPVKIPGDKEFSTEARESERNSQADTSSVPDSPVQTPYGAYLESLRPKVEQVLKFEGEISPEYSRTSRDIDFSYKNAAKVLKSNPYPQELIIERLFRIINANAISNKSSQ